MIYNKTFRGRKGQRPQAKVGHVSHVMLQWDTNNNFEQWKQYHARRASDAHGVRANLFRNGKQWKRGPMVMLNYTRIEGNGADGNPMPPLSDAEPRT